VKLYKRTDELDISSARICCRAMSRAWGILFYKPFDATDKVHIYHDERLFDCINFCPFCGAKIEFIEGETPLENHL